MNGNNKKLSTMFAVKSCCKGDKIRQRITVALVQNELFPRVPLVVVLFVHVSKIEQPTLLTLR